MNIYFYANPQTVGLSLLSSYEMINIKLKEVKHF